LIPPSKGFSFNLELANAIKNSTVFICCLTKKYCESKNCKNELEYADASEKKVIVLMFERFTKNDFSEIGGIGFIIGPMVRYNCYKHPDIFHNWSGEIFDSFLQAIYAHLNRSIDLQAIKVISIFFIVSRSYYFFFLLII